MRTSGHANGYIRSVLTGIWHSHDVLPQDVLDDTGKTTPAHCKNNCYNETLTRSRIKLPTA